MIIILNIYAVFSHCYLNIIVEHEILFAVSLERGDGVLGLEILELNEGARPT